MTTCDFALKKEKKQEKSPQFFSVVGFSPCILSLCFSFSQFFLSVWHVETLTYPYLEAGGVRHRRKRLIEDTAKSLRLKSDLQMDCVAAFYLQVFVLGWSSNFVGSESGQIHTECQFLQIYSLTNQTPHSPNRTLNTFTVHNTSSQGKGGGKGEC